ncbi:sugar transferase [Synechococcus sp. HJ21-Hayes]|nr:sugar transferase [Synechococcus sp. HJ21-Hayes]
MAAATRFPPVLRAACSDGLLLGLSWCAVYGWQFGAWPQLSRGPLGLILAWLLIHYLLGTYTALARHQLDLARQLRNCLAAAALVFALAAASTLLRGQQLEATMSRSFLLPGLALGLGTNLLLGLGQSTAHLWRPQQQWLLIAAPEERAALSQAIDVGACAIPCGIEWRASQAMPPLPEALPAWLALDGVALGLQHQPSAADRATLLAWQQQGLRLLSLAGWAETFLQRLPPELLATAWAERVEAFSHARSGPAARLKRLGDLFGSGLLLALLAPLAFALRPRLHRDACGGRDGRPFSRIRLAGSGRFSALPQLLNVWRGEMSLVGPRPLSLEALARLEARFPGAELRQWMRPGMTGWGRIIGPPPEEPDTLAWELARDLYYLRNHSLLLDLRLLATSLLLLCVPAAWRP